MKTKRWVLTALACFIAAIGTATEFPKMNVVPVEAEKAIVAFEAPEATLLEISLANDEGDILYFKRTRNRLTEYKKVFNFSDLGPGNYCISVNYGNRSISRKVEVTKKRIDVGPPERYYEPYFCLNDKKLNVSFFNCSQKPIYLNIYKAGDHVAGVSLGKDLAIQKCLDLSRLGRGVYRVVLTDCLGDHNFTAQL